MANSLIRTRHPLYKTWLGMMHRCHHENYPTYAYYGGRGILVCPEWQDFGTFVAAVGKRPEGHTLDRIDNNGNYEPGNVRWATRSQQQRNKRARGWHKRGNRYVVLVNRGQRQHRIGSYATQAEAEAAYAAVKGAEL